MSEIPASSRPERQVRVALSALVLGLVAVAIAFIPGAAFVAIVPAALAELMGVYGIRGKLADRWQSVAGVALGPIAIALALLTIFS